MDASLAPPTGCLVGSAFASETRSSMAQLVSQTALLATTKQDMAA